MRTGTGTKKGSERTEERRRSARNRTRGVDAMWETGKLGGAEKKRRQEWVGSVAADPNNLENRKEAGEEAQGT